MTAIQSVRPQWFGNHAWILWPCLVFLGISLLLYLSQYDWFRTLLLGRPEHENGGNGPTITAGRDSYFSGANVANTGGLHIGDVVHHALREQINYPAEWRALGVRFGQIKFGTGGIVQEIQGIHCRTVIHSDPVAVLCAVAGNLLLRSPKVASELPDSVRNEADAATRWLKFIHHVSPSHVEVKRFVTEFNVTQSVTNHVITVSNLVWSSKIACTKAEAMEM